MKNKILDTFISSALGSASVISGTIAPLLVNKKKISRIANVPYWSHPDQVLDIYRPKNKKGGTLPISIVVHGGGFRFFSKDSHARAAIELANSGQLVFSINYRLSPKYPYPSGVSDTIHAYSWIVENAAKYGGDINNISLVGESAGGNYILALCLHLFGIQSLGAGVSLPETPKVTPKHAVIHCGHLHVSDVDRYLAKKHHPLVIRRILQIQKDYLPSIPSGNEGFLADPLLVIEKLAKEKKSLPENFPQIFIPVGDRDPVAGDSIRLAQAMEVLGQKDRLRTYAGEGHAFYILPFSKNASTCWSDIIEFIKT